MPTAVRWRVLALVGGCVLGAQAQGLDWSSGFHPASSGWPFGPPHQRVSLVGVLARADLDTLCILLADQRVIRFRIDDKTQYEPQSGSEKLVGFHVMDVVNVDSEVDSKGYLLAHAVRFLRPASPSEQAEILRSPELRQKWSGNSLDEGAIQTPGDDRHLAIIAKPRPIHDRPEPPGTLGTDDRSLENKTHAEVIAMIRRKVNEAFAALPTLRAREVTSLFHSNSSPVKWIPDNVVSAEIAYEEDREFYTDIQIDGKRPADAPLAGTSDYMRSKDKAWSTGDFETLSHCVFSELQDSDFELRSAKDDHSVYAFTGNRNSACLGVKYRSEIAYPAYKGSITVNTRTEEVVHVEIEAIDVPKAFPLDRAERSIDFGTVRIGENVYLLPTTGYWFGCFRNSYACFLNRIDFRDYHRFNADSSVRFSN